MIDIKAIKADPEGMAVRLAKKGVTVDFTEFLQKDEERKAVQAQLDSLRRMRKEISKRVKQAMDIDLPTDELSVEAASINEQIKEAEAKVKELENFINNFLINLPNPPHHTVPAGGKENNRVARHYGNVPKFNFTPLDHVALAKGLDLIDYKRGVKLAGPGNWCYVRRGAILEWALLNYFIESHLTDGYEMFLPPHMLGAECGFVAGQFPKFADEVYYTDDEHKHFILPTAETALVNLHRGEILKQTDLPRKYFAYTPCYRKEAGSSRAEEKGMVRGHQFNKVELVQYTTPERSMDALAEMLRKATKLVYDLGLHFRVSQLAAQDCSWAMAITYDIEVWIPSMGIYKEVSSVSNAFEYQARRGNIRYEDLLSGKKRYVHTLNASGLATSRIFPAILEQFQQEDGSVRIPDVLKKWLPEGFKLDKFRSF